MAQAVRNRLQVGLVHALLRQVRSHLVRQPALVRQTKLRERTFNPVKVRLRSVHLIVQELGCGGGAVELALVGEPDELLDNFAHDLLRGVLVVIRVRNLECDRVFIRRAPGEADLVDANRLPHGFDHVFHGLLLDFVRVEVQTADDFDQAVAAEYFLLNCIDAAHHLAARTAGDQALRHLRGSDAHRRFGDIGIRPKIGHDHRHHQRGESRGEHPVQVPPGDVQVVRHIQRASRDIVAVGSS